MQWVGIMTCGILGIGHDVVATGCFKTYCVCLVA